jgi:hypothetical protein
MQNGRHPLVGKRALHPFRHQGDWKTVREPKSAHVIGVIRKTLREAWKNMAVGSRFRDSLRIRWRS